MKYSTAFIRTVKQARDVFTAIAAWVALLLVSAIGMTAGALPVGANAPGSETGADPTLIQITAIPGLQYDRVRFKVEPGETVKVVLENADEMLHNLVFTRPGERMTVVEAASEAGPEAEYVPDIREVLEATPLLETGETATLTFEAPVEYGVYPFVCTYPGHGVVMYGAMYVTSGEMPDITEDPNIPPQRREATAEAPSSGHPYELELPEIYRTFMPESSPASIAVGLPGGTSYCFDAGVSYLRYAWQGGFVDNTEHWDGNGNAFTELVGEIFYRNQSGFPLRLGQADAVPGVEFQGYRLMDDGTPEFHYTIDGVAVRELIRAHPNGIGLVREFEVGELDEPLWFVAGAEEGTVQVEASSGAWSGGQLRLSPAEAREFTITMTQ